MSEAENNPRVQKMRLKLQCYDLKIKHISGKSNVVDNAMSRLPTVCDTKSNKKILSAKIRPKKEAKNKQEQDFANQQNEQMFNKNIDEDRKKSSMTMTKGKTFKSN